MSVTRNHKSLRRDLALQMRRAALKGILSLRVNHLLLWNLAQALIICVLTQTQVGPF